MFCKAQISQSMNPIFASLYLQFQPTVEREALSHTRGMNGRQASCDSSQITDPGIPLVDSGRIRYIFKKSIGKITAKVESFR